MVGWHHQCNGHELGQTSGDGEGQVGLACCSPWGRKESDVAGQLNNNKVGSCGLSEEPGPAHLSGDPSRALWKPSITMNILRLLFLPARSTAFDV